ncbi:MAG: S4 domain-containing protein [Desulfopila sp.]|jgi:ribosome-associated heat shock protein Hsp15|nr:S4 domain-containing protein [Desulfopila sp.]
MKNSEEKLRIDKWLWAARFFKTRSLASQAVNGGKVHLNGSRVKSSRTVVPGDRMLITKGEIEFHVTVLGICATRRPASEASLLYEESLASIESRKEKAELRKMFNAGQSSPATKPGKRDRRKIREFIRKE